MSRLGRPFLALDLGNSSVKVAVWDGEAWSETVRFPSEPAAPEVWAERLAPLAAPGTPSGLASVVPGVVESLSGGVRLATGLAPVRVSAGLPLPFRMAYRTPTTLGADRIAAAAAAFALGAGRPVVAIDAGTAVTLDAVDVASDGPVYLGGAIAPGPGLLVGSLARGTRALPHVTFDTEARAVGGTTAEAIQTGVAGLFAGGVAHLLSQTGATLTAPPFVVATGGWSSWLVAHGLPADLVVPTLVLDGIRFLCEPAFADSAPHAP